MPLSLRFVRVTDMTEVMLHNDIPVDVIYICVNAPRQEVDAIIAMIRAEN